VPILVCSFSLSTALDRPKSIFVAYRVDGISTKFFGCVVKREIFISDRSFPINICIQEFAGILVSEGNFFSPHRKALFSELNNLFSFYQYFRSSIIGSACNTDIQEYTADVATIFEIGGTILDRCLHVCVMKLKRSKEYRSILVHIERQQSQSRF